MFNMFTMFTMFNPGRPARLGPRTALRVILGAFSALIVSAAPGAETQTVRTERAEPVEQTTPIVAVPGSVDVSSKIQPGESFRFSIRSRQVRQHQKPDESIIKWIERRAVQVTCEALAPDPAIGPRVRVTFDEINCTLMEPKKALRFTSEYEHMNVVGAAMTLAMEPIVGAGITLTLDGSGTIRRIEGADGLLKEKELRRYAEQIVGEDAIDLMIQPIFRSIARPPSEAQPSLWTSERRFEFPGFGSFDFDERWTIERKNEKIGQVIFSVESDATATINEQWPDATLTDSRTLGSMTWDEMSGRLVHAEINRFYTVDLENDPDGPSIAGEEVLTISAPLGEK